MAMGIFDQAFRAVRVFGRLKRVTLQRVAISDICYSAAPSKLLSRYLVHLVVSYLIAHWLPATYDTKYRYPAKVPASIPP